MRGILVIVVPLGNSETHAESARALPAHPIGREGPLKPIARVRHPQGKGAMNCCSRWYRFWGQVSVFSSIRSLGGTLAEVRAINDRGEVVGIGITAKGPIQYYALLWRPKPKKPKR